MTMRCASSSILAAVVCVHGGFCGYGLGLGDVLTYRDSDEGCLPRGAWIFRLETGSLSDDVCTTRTQAPVSMFAAHTNFPSFWGGHHS